jgi:broad specificity phosphatase PhoE
MSLHVVLALAAACVACSTTQVTRVILVRHAEKATGGGKDPDLSEAGRARAVRLARMTQEADIAAVFATQFKRTQQTVGPLAEARGLSIVPVHAGEVAALVRRILADHAGKVVLVAAHSNTVPAIIAALGGPTMAELAEDAFDDLFVITTDGRASGPNSADHTAVIHLHYDRAD